MESTSDTRTVNNTMRHQYRVLSDEEKHAVSRVKDIGLDFHDFVDTLGASRELSLAKTKIEEAVMWAVLNTLQSDAGTCRDRRKRRAVRRNKFFAGLYGFGSKASLLGRSAPQCPGEISNSNSCEGGEGRRNSIKKLKKFFESPQTVVPRRFWSPPSARSG